MAGRSIVHIEIPYSDREASQSFYEALCDWEAESAPMPDGSMYTMFTTGSVGTALSEVGEQVKPGDVLIYIGSDDIEADLKKVDSLGGTVVQPKMDIPGFGSLGVFIDPAGNQIAFWQSTSESD